MPKEERTQFVINQLLEFTGGIILINVSQCAKALGMSRDTVRKALATLNWRKNGKEKLFLICDVANVICEQ